jgi:hypothetical protein
MPLCPATEAVRKIQTTARSVGIVNIITQVLQNTDMESFERQLCLQGRTERRHILQN